MSRQHRPSLSQARLSYCDGPSGCWHARARRAGVIRLLLVILVCAGIQFFLGARAAVAQDGTGSYTVESGDTLGAIAARFGVSVDALVAFNQLDSPDVLAVGQVLLVPDAASGEAASLALVPTVAVPSQPGETLIDVAQRLDQDIQLLVQLNQLGAYDRLYPGQPVKLPRAAAPGALLRFGSVLGVDVPASLAQGRTGRVRVTASRPLSLTATWNGLPLAFTPIAEGADDQFALVPTPALLAPGPYPLVISYTASSGLDLARTWEIAVGDGGYESQDIALSPETSQLLAPELVQAELERVAALWSQVAPGLWWRGAFLRPIDAQYQTSSPFGTRRSYNAGPVSSYHAGQDFAAPEGAVVTAPASGIVVLAAPLDVRGTAVLIDHGRGIFTGYWHLSELQVAEGQTVNAGDLLGLVGSTGLSTGAHLHWELRINSVAVDPMQFIDEPLAPEEGAP